MTRNRSNSRSSRSRELTSPAVVLRLRPRLAAYRVGHDCFALRIWQNLLWENPDPEWETHDSIPYTIDRLNSCLLEIGPFVAPTALMQLHPILDDLRQLNERMVDGYSNPEGPNGALLRMQPIPGEELWRNLCLVLSPTAISEPRLSAWLAFGQTIGLLELDLQRREEEPGIPFDPVCAAARGILENDSQVPRSVRRLAEAVNANTAKKVLRVLHSAVTSRDFQHNSALFNVFRAVRALDLEIQTELEQDSSWTPAVATPNQRPPASTDTDGRPCLNATPSGSTSQGWCHEPHEQRPAEFAFGSVQGQKQELAAWVLVGRRDPRSLENAGRSGRFWIVRHDRTTFELWFRSQEQYARANGLMLRQRNSEGRSG